MKSWRRIIIRGILVIFVLSTVGIVVLYLVNPNSDQQTMTDTTTMTGDAMTGTITGSGS